jgi:hypothetical protein
VFGEPPQRRSPEPACVMVVVAAERAGAGARRLCAESRVWRGRFAVRSVGRTSKDRELSEREVREGDGMVLVVHAGLEIKLDRGEGHGGLVSEGI